MGHGLFGSDGPRPARYGWSVPQHSSGALRGGATLRSDLKWSLELQDVVKSNQFMWVKSNEPV